MDLARFDLILVQDLLSSPDKPVSSTAGSGSAEASAELQVSFRLISDGLFFTGVLLATRY